MQFHAVLLNLVSVAFAATSGAIVCTAEFKPVCARSRKWYPNACELKRAGKIVSKKLIYSAMTKSCVKKGSSVTNI